MTPEITRVFEIDMGHRLMNHEGKCRNAHGHRYKLCLSCAAPALDSVGRVIDFGALKSTFGAWLDMSFDHGFVLQTGDPLIAALNEVDSKCAVVPFSPTVENLAEFWLRLAAETLKDTGITVTKLRVYETPNCWAEVVNAAPHT